MSPAGQTWPAWRYWAIAGGLIALLAVVDLLGAASPFSPG